MTWLMVKVNRINVASRVEEESIVTCLRPLTDQNGEAFSKARPGVVFKITKSLLVLTVPIEKVAGSLFASWCDCVCVITYIYFVLKLHWMCWKEILYPTVVKI